MHDRGHNFIISGILAKTFCQARFLVSSSSWSKNGALCYKAEPMESVVETGNSSVSLSLKPAKCIQNIQECSRLQIRLSLFTPENI